MEIKYMQQRSNKPHKLRIKLLKFLQWESMGVHYFSIVTDGTIWSINDCFGNK